MKTNFVNICLLSSWKCNSSNNRSASSPARRENLFSLSQIKYLPAPTGWQYLATPSKNFRIHCYNRKPELLTRKNQNNNTENFAVVWLAFSHPVVWRLTTVLKQIFYLILCILTEKILTKQYSLLTFIEPWLTRLDSEPKSLSQTSSGIPISGYIWMFTTSMTEADQTIKMLKVKNFLLQKIQLALFSFNKDNLWWTSCRFKK